MMRLILLTSQYCYTIADATTSDMVWFAMGRHRHCTHEQIMAQFPDAKVETHAIRGSELTGVIIDELVGG